MDSSRNVSCRLDELMPLMRETLAAGQTVRFSPNGTSMLPLLRQGRDSVTLAPLGDEIRKNDIVLYQRKNAQYVLHRAVEVGERYVFLGDNQFDREYGITREQMIAVVCAVTRGGREYRMDGAAMRLYGWAWDVSRPVRKVARRGRAVLGRLIRG